MISGVQASFEENRFPSLQFEMEFIFEKEKSEGSWLVIGREITFCLKDLLFDNLAFDNLALETGCIMNFQEGMYCRQQSLAYLET